MRTKEITPKIVEKARFKVKKFKDLDKFSILAKIKEILMKCKTTESEDITALTTREKLTNKIFTKKIKIEVSPETEETGVLKDLKEIEYVSLSCDHEDFENCMSSDIRINCKNPYNEWANSFASAFTDDNLRFLYCLLLESLDLNECPDEVYDKVEELQDFIISLSPEDIKDFDSFCKAIDDFQEAVRKACFNPSNDDVI